MKFEQQFSCEYTYAFEELQVGECFIFEDHKPESGYIYPGIIHMKLSKKGSAVRMRDGWVVERISQDDRVIRIPVVLKINTEVE